MPGWRKPAKLAAMSMPDLNLLIALDVLLSERSVARAARRLRLSQSATSRALARLRDTLHDPLLVRAGRGLVPTPRALALQDSVRRLVQEAQAVLRPAEAPDLSRLVRTFTIRTREGFVENFGLPLIERLRHEAPGVHLRFLQKTDRESTALRDGVADLETGVVRASMGPEVRTRTLFRDRFIAVVRPGHPLADGPVTPARYAGADHIRVTLDDMDGGLVEAALAPLGLERRVATTLSGFAMALSLARAADLVATVPERYTGNLRDGLVSIPLPFALPEIPISLLWHPRHDADPAHQWLRGCLRAVCSAEE